jgi:hypothetical protein
MDFLGDLTGSHRLTTAKELASLIRANCTVETQLGDDEFICTFVLDSGRSQSILVSVVDHPGFQIIQVKSRCCVAEKPSVIRAALRRNISTSLGGLALDLSTEPAVIDLVQKSIVLRESGTNFEEFLDTVLSVVNQADYIEQRRSSQDIF